MKATLRLIPTFVLAVSLHAIPSSVTAQTKAAGHAIAMERFTKARQFYDTRALAEVFSPALIRKEADSLLARYKRYKETYPVTATNPDDAGVQGAVRTFIEKPSNYHFRVYAEAFRQMNNGRQDLAVYGMFAARYEFPERPTVITKSTYTLAKTDALIARYYLSETWVESASGKSEEKRFVVEWMRFDDGNWYLYVMD